MNFNDLLLFGCIAYAMFFTFYWKWALLRRWKAIPEYHRASIYFATGWMDRFGWFFGDFMKREEPPQFTRD